MNPYEQIVTSITAYKSDMESLENERLGILKKLESPSAYFPADIENFKNRLFEIKKAQEERTNAEYRNLDNLQDNALDRLHEITDIKPAEVDYDLIRLVKDKELSLGETVRHYKRANDSTKTILYRIFQERKEPLSFFRENDIINPQGNGVTAESDLKSKIASTKRYVLPWWKDNKPWERQIALFPTGDKVPAIWRDIV